MTKTELRKAITEILAEDLNLLADIVEELDDLVNFLEQDRWWSMSEFENVLGDIGIRDLAERCYWGKDLDACDNRTTFNPYRKYFRINAYGNLESSDVRDYSDWNDGILANDIAQYWGRINSVKGDSRLLLLAIALDEAED